jgi:hypothetical protein
MHGGEVVMETETDNDILPENVPAAARLLMDSLYLMLDDQVDAARLRAHRRRLRDTHRRRAVGQVETKTTDNGGRAAAQ